MLPASDTSTCGIVVTTLAFQAFRVFSDKDVKLWEPRGLRIPDQLDNSLLGKIRSPKSEENIKLILSNVGSAIKSTQKCRLVYYLKR